SPVTYLIERAIKWGNMPLEGWLSDVIKDNNVVDNIRDVLGTR
ncbi:type VI secretion system protein TssA, partial [Pseudomonas qingdaonensis]